MKKSVAIVGTLDSKGEEHFFLKEVIESKGYSTITIDIGTTGLSNFPPDFSVCKLINIKEAERSRMVEAVIEKAQELILDLYHQGKIGAIISAGGGTGTFMGTSIMKILPLGVPKFMVSTVAARDMSQTIGTKDITVMHSVVDMLGLNSISRLILARAAGAVCGMMSTSYSGGKTSPRVALSLFGFVTQAAESIKAILEENHFEVIPFHANGTGGMAMEEMVGESFFDGVLDLATHELVDAMFDGYCGAISPQRLLTPKGVDTPRLVIPGGLDAAVLEFDSKSVPEKYENRKIFFYDFRSAIRLTADESRSVARIVAKKLNQSRNPIKILIPLKGWSEGDREGDVLFDPESSQAFLQTLEKSLESDVIVVKVDYHINDKEFAQEAADIMISMVRGSG
ncbi:MAG: Tm-1-like ATP-binding domain-containing protein [Deltaproteobacteria bacterium]|nr:Tm-1-like ATP-binding domain-containing protein [Deltaproteobacteria bacterium]